MCRGALRWVFSTWICLLPISSYADVVIDPNAYECVEQLSSTELGILEARISGSKGTEISGFTARWFMYPKFPKVGARWDENDIGRGVFNIGFDSIIPPIKGRIVIGNCRSDQKGCGLTAQYSTNFRQRDGIVSTSVFASGPWGPLVSSLKQAGQLAFQLQDQKGVALREEHVPVATLLTVDREMRLLMDAVATKHADFLLDAKNEGRFKQEC